MDSTLHTTLFTQADRTHDPDFFVRFMDEGHKILAIQASKRLMLERLALAPGEAVLDVGCGPGIDVLDMAEHVGATGRLVGLDASAVMIAEARRRAEAQHIVASFEVGQVQALPFADGTFDVCRAERLLMHIETAAPAVAEMVRVTRRGGRVAIFDFDWDTLVIDHPDKSTTRTVVQSYSDSMRNGWIGRQLPRLLTEQGVAVTSLDPLQVFIHYAFAELLLGGHLAALQTQGTLTAAQAQEWWAHLRRAHERDTLLIGVTAFIVVGTRA
jgi:ubiquinone/menaquinone biosynthesis C-methylase UbiE